jgi:hypothetical protein
MLLLRVAGSHRIGCCSPTPSQRLVDLLPLHQLEPLRRLQRCRARRTTPLVRYTNPKPLSIMSITFRLTRCHPSRSLSTFWIKFPIICLLLLAVSGSALLVSGRLFWSSSSCRSAQALAWFSVVRWCCLGCVVLMLLLSCVFVLCSCWWHVSFVPGLPLVIGGGGGDIGGFSEKPPKPSHPKLL